MTSTWVKDRKSTRLNSSHLGISYAVFCLKKKKRSGRLAWPIQSRTARRWISRAYSRLCLELMPDRSTARIPGQLEAEPLQLLARLSVVRLDVRLAGGRLIEVLAAPEAGRRDQLQD